tara:strand:- start:125 stop:649 length:525 start_codon:yes stop_codon:yes gene_type:complete
MAQEFTIKSQQIEDKINQLLPSQGGAGAGIDFSASTMVIPVVDLTETAEGSSLRQDLQTALSLTSATTFDVNNTTTALINTTGYYRIIGTASVVSDTSGTQDSSISISDGTTAKSVWRTSVINVGTAAFGGVNDYDFNFLLKAGETLLITASQNMVMAGSVRQIADINGNLINP